MAEVELTLRREMGDFVLEDEGEYGKSYPLDDDDVRLLAEVLGHVLPDPEREGEEGYDVDEIAAFHLAEHVDTAITFYEDVDSDVGLLEEIGYEVGRVSLEQFDEAVDEFCEALGAERTSIESGQYGGQSDYKVEVLAMGPSISPLFGGNVEIGGWVTLQKSDWTIWADVGIRVAGESLGDSVFRAQYEDGEWPVMELEQL